MCSKQKGGKFIAEGAFGAIFSPPIDSKVDKKNYPTNSVGKIFERSTDANEEEKAQKIISIIDPKATFTVKYYGRNLVEVSDFKKSDEPEKTLKVSLKLTQYKYHQLIYENGGYELNSKRLYQGNMTFEKILQKFVPIMEGLVKLEKSQNVHNDIKPDNMLYNPETEKFSIIDFGIMVNKNDVYDNEKSVLRHAQIYAYRPPEYKVAYYITTKLGQNKDDVIKKSLEDHNRGIRKIEKAIKSLTKPDAKKNITKLVNDLYEKSDKVGDPKVVLGKYWNKVDIYSVGIILIQLLARAITNKKVGSLDMEKVKKFLVKMTHNDVRRRYSPEEGLEALKKIVNVETKSKSPVNSSIVKVENKEDLKKTKSKSPVKSVKKEDLKKKTVVELKAMIKAKGGKGYSKMKKNELIEFYNKL